MINISDKSKCCGCTACFNICPKQCITMQSDYEGFVYPKVDLDKCIHCNKCESVCPILNKPNNLDIKEGFIARNKNVNIVKNSSSGGVFNAICKYVITNNGIVFGVAFNENFEVNHIPAKNMDECLLFQGSKYVQSNLGGTFYKVKSYLDKDKLVCFSGTPCQVSGLKNYLQKDYSNLILVDLVCHGVPSSSLWSKYLELMSKKYTSKIVDINFRSKKYGYQSFSMMTKLNNHKKYYESPRINMFLKTFFSNIAFRPSCYDCHFKGIYRCSNFTLWDCWHAGSILNIDDDDLGYTNVIVRGQQGEKILNYLQNELDLFRKPVENIVPVNGGMMEYSAQKNPNRDNFYKDLINVGLDKTFDKYLHVSNIDYMLENCKSLLYKLGILKNISRLKKALRKKLK